METNKKSLIEIETNSLVLEVVGSTKPINKINDESDGDCSSVYRNNVYDMWDDEQGESKIASRLITILAFFIIFAMLFIIIISLRMSDMIDEKGNLFCLVFF